MSVSTRGQLKTLEASLRRLLLLMRMLGVYIDIHMECVTGWLSLEVMVSLSLSPWPLTVSKPFELDVCSGQTFLQIS